MLLNVVALAATVASCSFLVPQILRLVRTGDASGVSATMAAVGAVSCCAWMIYGLLAAVWPLALTGALATAEYLAFCTLLYRARVLFGRAMAISLAWIGALVIAACLGASTHQGVGTGLGAVLNAAVIAQYLPAVLETHRAQSTSGVALGTWALVAVNGALWMSYGGLIGDWALIGYGTAVSAAAIGVALGVARTRWSPVLPARLAKPPPQPGLDRPDAATLRPRSDKPIGATQALATSHSSVTASVGSTPSEGRLRPLWSGTSADPRHLVDPQRRRRSWGRPLRQ